MSTNKKFAGYAMHEFYMPTTGKGHKNRRDRKKCKFYDCKRDFCIKIFKDCVGPTVCRKYMENSSMPSNPKTLVGRKVESKYYGKGVVVSDDREYCTVQYETTKVQCKKETLFELMKE